MLWKLKISGDNSRKTFSSVIVEAEDWYTALKNGLVRQGIAVRPMLKLACSIHTGGGFAVLDRDADLIYELMPQCSQSRHETPTIPPPRIFEPTAEKDELSETPIADRMFSENASLWTLERGKKELCRIKLEKAPRDTILDTGREKPGKYKP